MPKTTKNRKPATKKSTKISRKKSPATKKSVKPKTVKGKVAKKTTPVKKTAKLKAAKPKTKITRRKTPVSKPPKRKRKVSLKRMIKNALLKEKAELLREVADKRKTESSLLKHEIGDIYDIASSERERELSLLLGDRDREKLAEIEEALERFEDKTYGLCEECGEPILEGRLLAMPFTRVCVDCKSREERLHGYKKKYEEGGLVNVAERLDIEEEEES